MSISQKDNQIKVVKKLGTPQDNIFVSTILNPEMTFDHRL